MTDDFLGISTSQDATRADVPAFTLEALIALRAELTTKRLGVQRIIAGCPACPYHEALKWERRSIILIGRGLLDTLEREAERVDFFSKVIDQPQVERKMFGLEVEHWGSKLDHAELLDELVRDLVG